MQVVTINCEFSLPHFNSGPSVCALGDGGGSCGSWTVRAESEKVACQKLLC